MPASFNDIGNTDQVSSLLNDDFRTLCNYADTDTDTDTDIGRVTGEVGGGILGVAGGLLKIILAVYLVFTLGWILMLRILSILAFDVHIVHSFFVGRCRFYPPSYMYLTSLINSRHSSFDP